MPLATELPLKAGNKRINDAIADNELSPNMDNKKARANKNLSYNDTISVCDSLIAALMDLHLKEGLVHTNIKPGTIQVDPIQTENSKKRYKVIFPNLEKAIKCDTLKRNEIKIALASDIHAIGNIVAQLLEEYGEDLSYNYKDGKVMQMCSDNLDERLLAMNNYRYTHYTDKLKLQYDTENKIGAFFRVIKREPMSLANMNQPLTQDTTVLRPGSLG